MKERIEWNIKYKAQLRRALSNTAFI